MSGRKPDYGPKVKYFSNTTGPGFSGFVRRVQGWAKKDRGELFNAIYRKVRKGIGPETLPFAQAIHIEVTNACNLSCVMCPHPIMERPIGRMTRHTFQGIIDQLVPFRRIIEGIALMGLGEPLLHKELEEFSLIAKKAGLKNIYTSTNAALLDSERSKKIIEQSGFDRIIFSVDGIEKETFEKVRKGASFDQVYGNIERFLKLKKEMFKGPKATLQILVMSETRNQLNKFCDYWVPLLGPDDEILVKEVDTFGGQVDDRRLDSEREPKQRFACRLLWKDFSISWDGRVTVCCKDVFYKLQVGNVHETPLADLWKNKKWEAIRTAHREGRFSMDPCEQCREWYL